MLLKGNIQLDSTCKSNLIDENKFNLETNSRTFLFKVNYKNNFLEKLKIFIFLNKTYSLILTLQNYGLEV